MNDRLTLKECRETFNTYSGQASEIARSMTLAGIAIVWVLREADKTNVTGKIPEALFWPLCLFALSALFDLAQYILSALIWHHFFREKEKQGVGEAVTFDAQPSINLPGWVCFTFKLLLVFVGYIILVKYVCGNFLA